MSTTEGHSEAASPTLAEVLSKGADPVFRLHPISGFWRRFFAFFIDGIVLGLVGQVIAFSMSPILFEIGPYGHIGGNVIALLYFGLMNSRLGRGQTLGKRAMHAAVRDAEGKPIGIGRSMLRTSIWLVPATLNGWTIPLLEHPVAKYALTIVVLGIGGAVLATMVFNRKTRQGLHDMLTETYVLRLDEQSVEALPATPRGQWKLAGVMVLIALVIATSAPFLVPHIAPNLQQLTDLQRALLAADRFFNAGVTDQTVIEEGKNIRALKISIWCKGKPVEPGRTVMMNDIARTALTMPNVNRFDLIRIELTSAYDLGIASGNSTHFDSETVSTWRERVGRR
jgi:uncharacterized RDD family membrane protein YckC